MGKILRKIGAALALFSIACYAKDSTNDWQVKVLAAGADAVVEGRIFYMKVLSPEWMLIGISSGDEVHEIEMLSKEFPKNISLGDPIVAYSYLSPDRKLYLMSSPTSGLLSASDPHPDRAKIRLVVDRSAQKIKSNAASSCPHHLMLAIEDFKHWRKRREATNKLFRMDGKSDREATCLIAALLSRERIGGTSFFRPGESSTTPYIMGDATLGNYVGITLPYLLDQSMPGRASFDPNNDKVFRMWSRGSPFID